MMNPEKRISAKECLKNPVFDSIRNPELEVDAPFKIYLDVDKTSSYNYETDHNILYSNAEEYRAAILQEILSFKSEA
jgi:hypothetical protein